MSIYERVMDTLADIGCPVTFLDTGKMVFPSVSFFVQFEGGEYFADDAEVARVYNVQIDVWSKGNYVSLVSDIQDAMDAAGFGRGEGQDLYDEETQIYHKALMFTYTESTI